MRDPLRLHWARPADAGMNTARRRRVARRVGAAFTGTADLGLGAAIIPLVGVLYSLAHRGQPVTVTYMTLAVAGAAAVGVAFVLLMSGMGIKHLANVAAVRAGAKVGGKATGAAAGNSARRSGWGIAATDPTGLDRARLVCDLLNAAGEARTATNRAHATYRVEALTADQETYRALEALSAAAKRLEDLAATLERLAAQATDRT
jgi:hypothetical protein